MPVSHCIDDEKKLSITRVHGNPELAELIEALSAYLHGIKSKPHLSYYNELLDLSDSSGVNVGSFNISKLADIAASGDDSSQKTKLAILVTRPITTGFAKMYAACRNSSKKNNKEAKVFSSKLDAMAWLTEQDDGDFKKVSNRND